MAEQQTVVVTGFGPFGSHTINASWLAVQELAKKGLGERINLVIDELPVAYSDVKSKVPKLWDNFRPKLVVHVGVSSIADCLTLEQKAYNGGYERVDIYECTPDTKCCVDGGEDCLTSSIDMTQVQQYVNNSSCGVKAIVSTDPGRYLCDFSYYQSLHINQKCAAFIHVPDIDKPYSAEQLAEGLRTAILAMLEQIASVVEK